MIEVTRARKGFQCNNCYSDQDVYCLRVRVEGQTGTSEMRFCERCVEEIIDKLKAVSLTREEA